MKFKVSSSELLKAFMDVQKAVPVKASNPIFENFLCVLKDGRLEITASDSELTLKTSIEVEDSEMEEGSMAIPAIHITELLKALPDQPLSISTVSDSSFECRWSSGNSLLPFFPAKDYPEIKTIGEGAITVEFPSQSLSDGIAGTIYATADDDIRPIMNGIFFDLDTDSATLVASDSHKLICYTTKDVTVSEKSSFILHKKGASILKSLIEKMEDTVKISFDSNMVVFSFGKEMMVCRLIVGNYPKYRTVIPQNNSNILKIDRVKFLNAARRIAVCASKASNYIKLDLKSGQLELSAQDLGFSISAYEKLECEYSGDDLTIGFKSMFLTEVLSNMACNTIVMKFADERRAALIVPSDEEADSEKICGILMPIMV